MAEFKDRIKSIRLELGLTQQELAKNAGISQAGIAKWETGDRTPSMDCLISLAKYFQCSIDYLVGIVDE